MINSFFRALSSFHPPNLPGSLLLFPIQPQGFFLYGETKNECKHADEDEWCEFHINSW